MAVKDERVRFCGHCNAVVGWFATCCAECGVVIGAESVRSAPASADARTREFFRAQMRICHRAREETMHLSELITTQTQRVTLLEASRATDASRRDLLLCGERLMELEEDWDEIQRRFNSASEALEEGMHTEVADIAATLDLPQDLTDALVAEGKALERDLAEAEERLCLVRRQRDVVSARHKHAWSGLATGARGTTALGVACFTLAAVGAWWGVDQGLPPQALGLSLLPAWLGLVVLFLNARAKSL